jgi:uncharacterized protein (DUF885 family)
MNRASLLFVLLVVPACATAPAPVPAAPPEAPAPAASAPVAPTPSEDARLAALLEEDWQWRLRENPLLATSIGDSRHDDRLTDLSFEAIARRKQHALDVRRQLQELPYAKFGQLTYEMWRAIRLVVDTGMHAKGWTREQAIQFFQDNASKTEHDITVEVDRYLVWPGQALAYKRGELKLKELRAHATRELGPRFDVRAFHDEVLGQGALPLSFLEARVKAWVERQKAMASGPVR